MKRITSLALSAALLASLSTPVLAAPAGQQGSHPPVDIVVELDGVERRFSVMAETLRDISGKFAGKVVLCRDVTEPLVKFG